MAITFEEEEQHAPVGTFFSIFFLLIIVGVGGFFGVRYLMSVQQSVVPSPSASVQLNKDILADPRLDSLELLPQIVLDPSVTVGRSSPFQAPATATSAVTPQNKDTKASVKSGLPSASSMVSTPPPTSQPNASQNAQ